MVIATLRSKAIRRGRKTIGALRSLLGLSYRSRLGEGAFFAGLAGRSIALVGNAASLAQTGFGAEIDGHDLVIRLNGAPIPSPLSHGSRTHILATSIVPERERVFELDAGQVIFMSPKPRYLPRWLTRRSDFFLYPLSRHAALMKEIGARPTTGLMVIDLLRLSACRSVDLYGFDFFASPSLSNIGGLKRTPHDFSAERSHVERLMAEDGRFQLRKP